MKTILCYGDSNTWGYVPLTGERYSPAIRWTGRLQAQLGGEYRVIEAGYNGRTTVFEDPEDPMRRGLSLLGALLEMNRPLDLVVLLLGTNDMKRDFDAAPEDIAAGMAALAETVRHYPYGTEGPVPQLLLVSPIHFGPGALSCPDTLEMLGGDCVERSARLAPLYEALARRIGCRFADAAQWAGPSDADGVHMDPAGHAAFADGICREIRHILP